MRRLPPRFGDFLLSLILVIILLGHILRPSTVSLDGWAIALIVLLIVVVKMETVSEVILGKDQLSFRSEVEELERTSRSVDREAAVQELRGTVEKILSEETWESDVANRKLTVLEGYVTHYRDLVSRDPEVAIVELGAEIEQTIREILAIEGVLPEDRTTVQQMLDILEEQDIMGKAVLDGVGEFWNIRNRVVHSPRVDQESAERAVQSGTRLLDSLSHYRDFTDVTETDFLQRLSTSPQLIEDGLEIEGIDVPVGARRRVDIVGVDAHGRPVFAELKLRNVTIRAISQLEDILREWNEQRGEQPRGIILAPGITSPAQGKLEESPIEYLELRTSLGG